MSNFTYMKLLITGGAGFMGSAVIRHIIKNTNDDVVCLGKLTYASNLESHRKVATVIDLYLKKSTAAVVPA